MQSSASSAVKNFFVCCSRLFLLSVFCRRKSGGATIAENDPLKSKVKNQKSKVALRWLDRLRALNPLSSRLAGTKSNLELAFPPGFIASIERLRLVALKAMGGGLREGHRLGAYKGGQLEFHGHRNYVPGDDLRYVDWNTYARLERPYVKEFAREEAGVLHLLLDATPSMILGTPSKWTFARRVAALFCHVALASKDLARVHVFHSDGTLERFPAHRSGAGIREYLDFLEAQSPRATNISNGGKIGPAMASHGILGLGVANFLRTRPPRGRIILIGDFWQEEKEIVQSVSRLASSGYDVAGIHVLSAEELIPPLEGQILARGMEEDDEIELASDADLASRYGHELDRHSRSIEDTFRRRGGNYLRTSSDASIEKVLIATLRQRRFVT